MNKSITLLLCLALLHLTAFAQTPRGIIKGKVTSFGKPVEYAGVGLTGTNFGTTTDKNGLFLLKNIPYGAYQLQVHAIGFEKVQKPVTVQEKEGPVVSVDVKPVESHLGEVVISGTLKESYTSLSPIKVEVYTPTLFKKNPTPSVFEALQMVNGVQPQLNCNVCNTGDIHINGMEGPYTMITIDGMPIVSGLSSVYGLSGIPNSMIERIEVVKGPASTLYGSEAVGGLINVITKSPQKAPLVSVDVFGTSQRELNADVAVKTRVGKATSLLGLNYFNFNNRLDVNNDNFTDVTLQDRISVFNKWSLTRKDNRVATLAARYVYEDRWGGELQWNPEFRGGDSVYAESIYTSRYEIIGAYQLPVSKEKITLQYSYNNHNQNSVYGTTVYKARQNVAFAQLLWDRQFGVRHDVVVGLPFRYTFYDDNTPGTQRPDGMNRPQHTFLPGIFAQDNLKLTDKLSTLAGIRYDYNSDHGSIFSPRLSFKYAANQNNIFRVSAGNGYRVVNLFTEDHAALSGAREVVIRNELKPERSQNINLNYQTFINHDKGFIGLDGSLFYTYFTNKIVGDFLSNDQQIIYDNLAGHAVSKGITLNTDFTFTYPLKVILGATLMDVYSVEENEDGEMEKLPQIYAPPVSGTFAVSYTINKIGLSLDYTGRVNGPMPLPVVENDYRPDRSPWFSIQNLQLTKKVRNGLEVYGGIKNLLNFLPKDVILRPFDPFDKRIDEDNPNGYSFDPSYIYAPIQGRRTFLGLRWTL